MLQDTISPSASSKPQAAEKQQLRGSDKRSCFTIALSGAFQAGGFCGKGPSKTVKLAYYSQKDNILTQKNNCWWVLQNLEKISARVIFYNSHEQRDAVC